MNTLYVLSGAGLSAESQLATFRNDPAGLWAQHSLAQVCDARTWKDHREAVFRFYNARKKEVIAAVPNAAHRQLARWQQQWGPNRVRLLTQNVDDLLERAGALEVTHLHGNLREMQCTACGTFWAIADELFDPQARCPKCTSLKGVKPAVVFFHERAPAYLHLKKMRKAISQDDLLVVIGTSLEVLDLEALLPRWRHGHAHNVQINPSPVSESLFGTNIAEPASQGCATLTPWLTQKMGA